MTGLKTRTKEPSVESFINSIADETKRQDALTVLGIMKQATKAPPRMWGSSIVGFGSYHYRYESGREGDWFLTGFSPRKQSLTLYITPGFIGYRGLLRKLGKYKTGKSCLYVNKLEDVHLPTLKELVARSVKDIAEQYG